MSTESFEEVVEVFSSRSYPWKLMVEAAYRKYPNPYSEHVHSLDTVQRSVSGRRLYSNRLFCTVWNLPALVLKASTVTVKSMGILISICFFDDCLCTGGRLHSSHAGQGAIRMQFRGEETYHLFTKCEL